jgi:dolichol-phosphate mannosyltransferase
MKPTKKLVVIVPAHNEEANLELLVRQVCAVEVPGWETELLIVDDGSTDGSLEKLRGLRSAGWPVGFISFTRCFGQQAALEAGLRDADGDAVITMDADLQHPPSEIPRMIAAHEAGADVVQMVRDHQAPGMRGMLSRLFYWILARSVSVEVVSGASEFRLLSWRVLDVIKRIPENGKLFRTLIPSLGFPQVHLPFAEAERAGGTPVFTFSSSFRVAARTIFNYSTLPLKVVFWMGLGLAVVSFGFGLGHVIVKLLWWDEIHPGFTDVITAIFFLSGCILLSVGILGRYLMIALEQIRGRPTFVVQERATTNGRNEILADAEDASRLAVKR